MYQLCTVSGFGAQVKSARYPDARAAQSLDYLTATKFLRQAHRLGLSHDYLVMAKPGKYRAAVAAGWGTAATNRYAGGSAARYPEWRVDYARPPVAPEWVPLELRREGASIDNPTCAQSLCRENIRRAWFNM